MTQNVKFLLGLLLVLSVLVVYRPSAWAQSDPCVAQVYYSADGKDEGDCRHPDSGLCATKAYALQQGLQQCIYEVQLFSNGLLRDTYRNPTLVERKFGDWIIVYFYWSLPVVVGISVGWMLGQQCHRSIFRRKGKEKHVHLLDTHS